MFGADEELSIAFYVNSEVLYKTGFYKKASYISIQV